MAPLTPVHPYLYGNQADIQPTNIYIGSVRLALQTGIVRYLSRITSLVIAPQEDATNKLLISQLLLKRELKRKSLQTFFFCSVGP